MTVQAKVLESGIAMASTVARPCGLICGKRGKGNVKRLASIILCMFSICVLSVNTTFAFDANWQLDESGAWYYITSDGTKATNAWVHDASDKQCYLVDENGTMRTGFQNVGGLYYLLDDTQGTGAYGRMLHNGDAYNGISIQAEPDGGYFGGHLEEATLEDLESLGISRNAVPKLSITKHIVNGKAYDESEYTIANTMNTTPDDPRVQSVLEQIKEHAKHIDPSPLRG